MTINTTKAIELASFAGKPILAAALALLGIASATVQAQDALNDVVVSIYWKSQETSTPLPAGFLQVHMEDEKVGSAATSGRVLLVRGKPIATKDIDGSHCGPGQLVVQFDTGTFTCEWVVAE